MGKGEETSAFGWSKTTSNSNHQQSAGSTQLPSSYTGTHGNTTGASHTGGTHGNTTELFSTDYQKAPTYGIPTSIPSSSQPISSYIKKGVETLGSAAGTLGSVAGTLGSAAGTLGSAAGTLGGAAGTLSSAYLAPPKLSSTAAAELKQLEKERAAVKRLQGELAKERAAVKSLQGELAKGRAAVKSLQGELAKERAAVKSLQGELQTERATVISLRGELQTKRAEVEVLRLKGVGVQALKNDIHRLSGHLREERDAVRTLKTEKDAANRLKTDTERALLKKGEELTSVRKQLREAELNLKSSAESRNELQRSYDQIDIKNKGLNRSKTMAEVYENYRQWSEDQTCRLLGMKKYDSWELQMAVNRANKESTRTNRYGAVYKSTLDQKDVVVEILNNKSKQTQQDFNQKIDILTRLRHPNLVSYIGAYEKNYALICEYFPKDTLQVRLVDKSHKAPFSWEERVEIAASICSTLLFLHNTKPSPIIQGDLKAENICFDEDNVCRLSVFGMSRSTQHTTTNNTAPSIQSDICDFGIVLLQMVTGQGEKGLVRTKVLSMMGDVNQFQGNGIGWQREVLTNKNIVDSRLDDCPIEGAVKMLLLGLRCSNPEENQRPDLATEVWTQIQSIKMGVAERRL